MNRTFQFVGLICLLAAGVLADQNKAVKAPSPARNAPNNGGGARVPPPRLTNPANPVARLYQATPEQRERVIEKLPPLRQEAMRKNLAYFDSLPKEQQHIMLRQAERFATLTPEKRVAFRQQMQALQQLPKDREVAVRMALRRLQVMPEEQRSAVLNSSTFRNGFSLDEQRIILNLSEVFLPPM